MHYINVSVDWINENKREIEEKRFPEKPIKHVVEVIVTRSYWRSQWYDSGQQKARNISLCDMLRGRGFERCDKISKDDLDLVIQVLKESRRNLFRDAAEGVKFFKEQLEKHGSFRKWISCVYKAVKEKGVKWKTAECTRGLRGVGYKGINDLLRNLGYLDRIPIDIHEKRFLIRTGIALLYGSKHTDPLDPQCHEEALRNYCKKELKGKTYKRIKLEEAPGLIDLAIWRFACKDEKQNCKAICAVKPKCDKCPINQYCLYYKLKSTTRTFNVMLPQK